MAATWEGDEMVTVLLMLYVILVIIVITVIVVIVVNGWDGRWVSMANA